MKKILVAAMLAGSLIGTQVSQAHTTTHPGSIAVGNPATAFTGGVTEIGAACDTSSPLNGVDGVWVDITAHIGTHTATVVPTGANAAVQDLDLWFYTASCGFINVGVGAANGFGASESATIPGGTGFIIVDLFAGAAATYTLTVS